MATQSNFPASHEVSVQGTAHAHTLIQRTLCKKALLHKQWWWRTHRLHLSVIILTIIPQKTAPPKVCQLVIVLEVKLLTAAPWYPQS